MELDRNTQRIRYLKAYLNCVPLSETIYGVKAAAKSYFGKELDELSLKQMVCIAAVTQYPWRYNPRRATYVTGEVGALQNRMNIVVERMYAAGFIDKEQYEEVFVLNPNGKKTIIYTPGLRKCRCLKNRPQTKCTTTPILWNML